MRSPIRCPRPRAPRPGPAVGALVTVLLAAGLALAAPNNGHKAKNKPAPAPAPAASALPVYTIGPNDVLNIDVWHEKDLSVTLPVRPDGEISLPLIGQVRASGYTPLQFQQILAEKLSAYIDHPRVTVVVKEVLSRTFNVLGKVIKPGTYSLDQPTTVIDALALAGGPAQFANTKKIYVLRYKKDGSRWIYPFNYPQVIRGHLPWENIRLKPGDTVVVP
ncbi:MAG: polysaccharide biosynthesis/export family protein [Terriglobales bacterium]